MKMKSKIEALELNTKLKIEALELNTLPEVRVFSIDAAEFRKKKEEDYTLKAPQVEKLFGVIIGYKYPAAEKHVKVVIQGKEESYINAAFTHLKEFANSGSPIKRVHTIEAILSSPEKSVDQPNQPVAGPSNPALGVPKSKILPESGLRYNYEIMQNSGKYKCRVHRCQKKAVKMEETIAKHFREAHPGVELVKRAD
uniref:C2H2-type domain-containing protein n=1 Tax=Ditylenchus dipsaci TaxID=166011 RepID=A0A915DHD3_9BILA